MELVYAMVIGRVFHIQINSYFGLPEPEMREQDGGMLVTLFKDTLTEDQLRKKDLNERQVKAVLYVKENGSITNAQYQKLFNVARNTASDDLKKLTQAGIFKSSGAKGAGAFYSLP